MSEEDIFNVNWEQRAWNTPENAQELKLYSYPSETIRNISVLEFVPWLVLLLAAIGGVFYTLWMAITGNYEDGNANTRLAMISFMVLFYCLLYKSVYNERLITYTDVLHAVLMDASGHAYVVHLNSDAFFEATGLWVCRIDKVMALWTDRAQRTEKRIKNKDFLLKRIQNKDIFQDMILNDCFDKVALPTEKILKFRNLGGCFTVTYSYKCYGREYKDKVRFYHSIQDYKELRDYFKERYHAEK